MGEDQTPLIEQLYAQIGQLKVQNNFLKKVNVVPVSNRRAIQKHGKQEILNSNQGSQFTGEVYTELLQKKWHHYQYGWMST